MAWTNNYIREKTMRGNQSFMSQFKKYIWAFHIFLRLKFFRLSRRLLSTFHQISIMHYSDVIMGGTASQITSLVIFTQPIIQTKIQENIKVPRHWLCAGNSPVTCEFPAQMASNAKNVSIWWRHHDGCRCNGDTRSQGTIGHDINLFPQYIFSHQHYKIQFIQNYVLHVSCETIFWSVTFVAIFVVSKQEEIHNAIRDYIPNICLACCHGDMSAVYIEYVPWNNMHKHCLSFLFIFATSFLIELMGYKFALKLVTSTHTDLRAHIPNGEVSHYIVDLNLY